MTATLTRDFAYTDYVRTQNSSVISDLYYNADDQTLVVFLHSGVSAGYSNVSTDVFKAFAAQNNDQWGSVGAYWNKWLKGHSEMFPGFDTNNIERFVSVNDVVDDEEEDVTFNGVSSTDEEVVPVVWYVGIDDEESISPDDLTLYAVSLSDAVEKALAIADLAGWKKAEVISVAKY